MKIAEFEPKNAAQAILAQLGVYKTLGMKKQYRYATPERAMRKGEDGSRKPGGYGKGLRNWINRENAKRMAAKAKA